MAHLEDYGYLNDKQHGFRKGRSCETQLALAVNDIARVLDDKGQVDVIIMDFSKAFDTVPHERLLAKLKHAGVRNSLHNWVKNFLTKRTQKVTLDGVSSPPVSVTSGVPQGTVLGPLLTDMISSLGWESLEHRRAAQRLTLIYKSINKLVAIDLYGSLPVSSL